ncbi:MAG: hypothetical protein EOP84_09520 [Verrucomicrobiaceae bacterium]|nr:MAG: hypothetical protein EOP84_09520 [Verrucomicrobiaceae bacterium]
MNASKHLRALICQVAMLAIIQSASAANLPPVAAPDSYSALEGTMLSIDTYKGLGPGVLRNDSDPEGKRLTTVLISGTTNGQLDLQPYGGFTYTPTPGFTGTDQFLYKATNGIRESAVVWVSIEVYPLATIVNGGFESGFTGWKQTGNTAIESATPYVPTEGTRLASFNSLNRAPNGTLSQVIGTEPGHAYAVEFDMGALAYNSLPQALRVTVHGFSKRADQIITVFGTGGGANRWQPCVVRFTADDFTSAITFSDVSASGANIDLLLDNVRIVEVPVPPDTPPVAQADAYSVDQDTALAIPVATGILANDTDAEYDMLTATLEVGPMNGTLVLNRLGDFTYTPSPGFTGTDSFSYHAVGSSNNSNTANVIMDT